MIRVAIICFLISVINYGNSRAEFLRCTFSIDELQQLKQFYKDAENRMNEETTDQSENAAIVLGNGRSGKSTIVNYLMGNELVAYKEGKSRYSPTKIQKADNDIEGPNIASGPASVTAIPSKWNSIRPELQDLDIWDTAGLADNRNSMQDFENSFHLYHLTKKVNSLKFILVIDFNDIDSDNISNINAILKTLVKYFKGMYESFMSSISVIISKAPLQNIIKDRINHTYISKKLSDNLLNSKLNISEVSKDFVRHIINNNQSVAFFWRANVSLSVDPDNDFNIISAINNCDSIIQSEHQDIGFTYSPESELCLRNAIYDLDVMNELLNLTERIDGWYTENVNAIYMQENKTFLRNRKNNLEQVQGRTNISSLELNDMSHNIDILKNMCDIIENYFKKENLAVKLILIEFTESILNIEMIIRIRIMFEGIITLLYDRTTHLITFSALKINEITALEHEERIRIQNEAFKKEKKALEERIKKLKQRPKERKFWSTFFLFFTISNAPTPGYGYMK